MLHSTPVQCTKTWHSRWCPCFIFTDTHFTHANIALKVPCKLFASVFISQQNLQSNLLNGNILKPKLAQWVSHQWSFSGHKLWCEHFYCSPPLLHHIFSVDRGAAHGPAEIVPENCLIVMWRLSGSPAPGKFQIKLLKMMKQRLVRSLFGDGLQQITARILQVVCGLWSTALHCRFVIAVAQTNQMLSTWLIFSVTNIVTLKKSKILSFRFIDQRY